MAARKLSLPKLLLLRRHHTLRTIFSSSPSPSNPSSPSSSIEPHHFANTSRRYSTHGLYRYADGGRFVIPHKFSTCYRSFWSDRKTPTKVDDPEGEENFLNKEGEELSEPGFFDYDYGSGGDAVIAGEVSGAVGGGEEMILPARCFVWFMDSVHDFTGMPWWMVIVSSTLALRFAILPVLLVQLSKLEKIAGLTPKLPPPFPQPFSGKSWIEQYRRFRCKRKEIGCPSFLWILAYPSVQIPCFILGTTSVRHMALDHHSGFECGGTLWFQNLNEIADGASGFIFPLLLVSLHLLNVQISFDKPTLKSLPNLTGLLAKYYKLYVQCLTIPIFFVGLYLPQGSLLYWATNSSITLVQLLIMKHLRAHQKLEPEDSGRSQEVTVPLVNKAIQDLSLIELFNLSIKHLSKGESDRAVPLLRLALEKDPEYVRALIVMGQLLLKNEKLVEATEYLERAITKLLLVGHPTKVEEIDHLILASLWAGVAYAKQGKVAAGIVHLKRIANMKEPEDPKSKTHYCDGLFLLSSALANVGRDAEATKYLQILMTYDPAYGAYLKDLESKDDNFIDDLANSRRKDY